MRGYPPPVSISIHSPHARGDVRQGPLTFNAPIFQSTPLMRGETLTDPPYNVGVTNFNPLPSCEGRPHGWYR